MNLIGRIVDIHYSEEKNCGVIRVFVRTVDKQSAIIQYSAPCYCYVSVNNPAEFISATAYQKNKPKCSVIIAKGYDGFNDQQSEFVKCEFTCNSLLNMWTHNRYFKFDKYNTVFYESDIDPKIRFIHLTHVNPSGMICIPIDQYTKLQSVYIYNGVNLPNLLYESKQDIPLLITSFDIECDSVTGQFPLAEKSYDQFFNEVFDWFNKNIFSRSLFYNVIFKSRNNKDLQHTNWNALMDIILSKDYFKISIGGSIRKLVGNEQLCNDAKMYMLHQQVTLPNEVTNILDNTIIPAIKKTLTITNLRTYEQLVDVAVKILHSGLPMIDIDALNVCSYNFDKTVLDDIFDIGFAKNFNWKQSVTAVKQYYSKLPKLQGDEIIQIGTVSQWSNEQFPIEKAIFMLDNSDPFNNSDLIDLENNDLQKEHTDVFPQKELDIFFKQHNIKPSGSYDTDLATMKEWNRNNQHANDHAIVRINIFTTNMPVYRPIVKIIAKHLNQYKPEQTFAQCCNFIAKNKYATLEDILNCSIDHCQWSAMTSIMNTLVVLYTVINPLFNLLQKCLMHLQVKTFTTHGEEKNNSSTHGDNT